MAIPPALLMTGLRSANKSTTETFNLIIKVISNPTFRQKKYVIIFIYFKKDSSLSLVSRPPFIFHDRKLRQYLSTAEVIPSCLS